MFETLDPSSSWFLSSGVAVVEPNGRLRAVVRKREFWVAFATPTERRRRAGLEKESKQVKQLAKVRQNGTENLEEVH